MKNIFNQKIVLLLILSSIFLSCKKEPTSVPQNNLPTTLTGKYEAGVFVINEGAFGSGTGTISFYNRGTSVLSNDIFNTENNASLGNIVQSFSIYNKKGYVVVNNANKVEVVNASTFKSVGTITGFVLPRYFLEIDSTKAYVTEWGSGGVNGAVKVVDLKTNTIIATINTGKGAEQMVKNNNYVYVTCAGGFGNDSVVTVINTNTNAVEANIVVGSNPNGIKMDANGFLWVLCSGQWNSSFTALEKLGSLVRINSVNNTIAKSLGFLNTQPSSLAINSFKNQLYYSFNNKVYAMDIADNFLPSVPLINKNFYGLDVDPTTNIIYGADAGNFSSNGYTHRYSTLGTKIDSFQVGIIPRGFCFK